MRAQFGIDGEDPSINSELPTDDSDEVCACKPVTTPIVESTPPRIASSRCEGSRESRDEHDHNHADHHELEHHDDEYYGRCAQTDDHHEDHHEHDDD